MSSERRWCSCCASERPAEGFTLRKDVKGKKRYWICSNCTERSKVRNKEIRESKRANSRSE